MIQKRQCEYLNIEENIIVEVCPIVAGPVYRTISQIFYIIIEPSLTMISDIAKDSYGTTPTIVLLILNTLVEYWTEKLQNALPLLQHFNKQIIVDFLYITTFGFKTKFFING